METKYKIGLLFDSSLSSWVSCNSILANLLHSYELTNFKTTRLFYSNEMSNKELSDLSEFIIDNQFTHLIFADYRLLPGILLREVYKKTLNLPEIFIHIYGDFFLNRSHWAKEKSLLQNFRIKFICASSAQTNFLKNFTITEPITVPFAISEDFIFIKNKRVDAREKFSFSDKEIVLCYSGRISLQKNVLDIISTFSFLTEFIPNLNLLLAGPFDDIGIPYIGLSRRPLTMEHEFYAYIGDLSTETRKKIFYLGNLNQNELVDFYHAADLYISLSTHNDEDFGMAPAEALTTGLPLILSNWGGFSDFKRKMPGMVELIDVVLQDHKIKPSKQLKQKILQQLIAKKSLSPEERTAFSNESRMYYSPQAISLKLKALIEDESKYFDGFNNLFFTTVKATNKIGPFQSETNSFNNLYKQLYRSYFNKVDP